MNKKTGMKSASSGPGRGPGRPKGSPNKTSAALKEMILKALDESGGVSYLVEKAADPKTSSAFLSLLGKVLPLTLYGDPNAPLQAVVKIERVIVDPKNDNAAH